MKVPSQKPPGPNSKVIPPQAPPGPQGVVFSFKHLHIVEPYTPARRDGQYTIKLLERFRAICGMRRQELISSRSESLKCHPIDFARTASPDGFTLLPPALQEEVEPMQFTISKNEHGRVHGFFIQDVFHVVWLDPEHQLFP